MISLSEVRWVHWAIKACLFMGPVLFMLALFPRGNIYQYTVDAGDEWLEEGVVAPFDFSVYKSEDELQTEREDIRVQSPLYFSEVDAARSMIGADRDTLSRQLDRLFETYASYRVKKQAADQAVEQEGEEVNSDSLMQEADRDSLAYADLRRVLSLKLTNEQWQVLVDSYPQRIPELSEGSEEPPPGESEYVEQRLLDEAWGLTSQLITAGVMDVSKDSVWSDRIVVRNEPSRTEIMRDKEGVYGLDEAFSFVGGEFEEQYGDSLHLADIGAAIFRAIFMPTLHYMRGETLAELRRRQDQISPTRGKVAAGDVIIEQGQRVTAENLAHLTSLERTWRERGAETAWWRVVLGQFLVIFASFFILFLCLYVLSKPVFDDNRQVLLLAILLTAIIGLYAAVIRIEFLRLYIVPVTLVPILITVIFNPRVAVFSALTLALVGGHLMNYNFEFTFATIVASIFGIFSVRDIRNRARLFVTAGMVFIGYLVIIGAMAILLGQLLGEFLEDMLQVAIHAFLLILAYPLLWVFESTFDITTDLTLLELSDTNRPLLKRMSMDAPGTFNHTLQVANFAEAAAGSIGANPLLVRVGALYHDIGKLNQPQLFIENQHARNNPHDALEPWMSASIITNHVRDGVELGRQHRLPRVVLDFIASHHGTTRLEYFYHKALKQRGEGDPKIDEADFRYPGPLPNSKESCIVMLADCVEAASRSLDEPTYAHLEALIDSIFAARVKGGQFDQADLTFQDLSRIKATFLTMLVAVYHLRIKYPGQEEGEGQLQDGQPQDGQLQGGEVRRRKGKEQEASVE